MRRHATLLAATFTVTAIALLELIGQVSSQETKPGSTDKSAGDTVTRLLKVQLQSAQKPYRASLDKMKVQRLGGGLLVLVNDNHPDPEEAYTWSVRWLDAQRDLSSNKDERIAAFTEHHQRMKDLRQQVTLLVGDTGVLLPFSATAAADWYLAESELWLQKEQGK